jgi:hypothetical protein
MIQAIIDGNTGISTSTPGNPLYGDAGWVQGVPWLYYRETPTEVLRKSNRVDMTVSFFSDSSDRNSSLKFYFARYHMNGTFLGFQLLTNQLNICPFNYDDAKHMLTFGTVT